ncbi:MAG: S1 RNA-binding domain-containing protein [Burkholderiaceae bacterium]
MRGQGIEAKYPVRRRFKGTVTNIADYGAFVELEPGVEGLIHVSEMSWTKKNIHPGKIVSTSQQVDVQILEVDPQQAPHLARPQADPGQPVGCVPRRSTRRARSVEGPIRNITEFGLFIGLDGGVDGMVHLSDLDWNKPGDEVIKDYKKGDNGQGRGARRRQLRRSASRSASSSSAATRSTRSPSTRRATPVTCEVVAGRRRTASR